MSSEVPVEKKLPLLKLAIASVVVLAVAALFLRGGNWRTALDYGTGLMDRVMTAIRNAGPLVFFIAMALLPAVGAPMLAFTLVVGSVFGDRMGMTAVVILSLVATVVNMIVTYILARRVLRPPLEWLIARLGYKLPEVEAGDITDLVIILRVTPGVPFCVQNYLLGLAEAPFGKFMAWSCALCLPQTVGFVLFGDALLHGKGKMLLTAALLLVAATAAAQLLRRHYSRKKLPA
jgi:uncharacterized membrane protein YdjX (TVP38/TMEM64 family)